MIEGRRKVADGTGARQSKNEEGKISGLPPFAWKEPKEARRTMTNSQRLALSLFFFVFWFFVSFVSKQNFFRRGFSPILVVVIFWKVDDEAISLAIESSQMVKAF